MTVEAEDYALMCIRNDSPKVDAYGNETNYGYVFLRSPLGLVVTILRVQRYKDGTFRLFNPPSAHVKIGLNGLLLSHWKKCNCWMTWKMPRLDNFIRQGHAAQRSNWHDLEGQTVQFVDKADVEHVLGRAESAESS